MAQTGKGIGNYLAPWPFILFAVLFLAAAVGASLAWGTIRGIMLGFDLASFVFLGACAPMFRHEAEDMRRSAKRNDANRVLVLAISAAVLVVIMVAVGGELTQKGPPGPLDATLVIVTLMMTWFFSNLVYALHYAHLFYTASPEGRDCGGLKVPETDEPDYWDFAYFAACIGMTFQTSDIDVLSRPMRRTLLFHAIAAFVVNIGVIAFAINVLGGS